MKRYALCLISLYFLFLLPCGATAPEEAIADYYDALPKEVADALPEEVAEGLRDGDPTAATALDASFLLRFMGRALTGALGDGLSSLLTLTATVFLAALLHAFSDTAGEAAGKAVGFAAGLSALLSVLHVVKPAWQLASDTIDGIGLLSKSLLPVMSAIGVASGGVSASAIHATWLTILLSLVEQITETVLPPLFGIGLGFLAVSLVSRLTEGSDMSGIVTSIKRAFTILLTLVGAVLSAIMAYQSVLAKSSDTVLLRSIKFASGNLIPVVGSTLSETAGSYLASLSLVRSSMGTVVAVSLLLFVLPPVVTLLICRFGMGFLGTVAGLLGAPQEGELLREASALLDLAIASLAILSGIFLLLTGVFSAAVTG